ncbi:ubiquinone-dependent pyruvate dehydrogenase [Nocardia sp. 2]|uniref:Ubiquinone-dependent pyruvate dehydrogenase n=1 Tax=Nocardia acididurans TaxID=2802282 RepID=A0ABS1M5N7_9NOCA|nr:thiamine pyrophosphate-dependent enzyme [Nocardia acididurans]MBL1075490.1 ubiquinone-dependent pyruvate dehydrogenase [Nocardia acididurans]
MAKNVADGMWEMLVSAGVRRCYGIVGDALNPVIDALRRNGQIEFVHVRHEEYGVFAAVAEATLTGRPVAVCGTAGPGVTHLINGLIDARREGAPVIAIAGDTETGVQDSSALEELNPYRFFETAAHYIGRLVNPDQLHHVVGNAITVAVAERGPTVIAVPADTAQLPAPKSPTWVPLPATRPGPAHPEEVRRMAELLDSAGKIAIFGGDGCATAGPQVRELARTLQAPVGYSLKGKQWLEHDNPNAVGMTGLLGYGGCWEAINKCDVLLMLGTDFPFKQFLPQSKVKVIQVDRHASHLGRRVPLEQAVLGDVAATVDALLPLVKPKQDSRFLDKCVKHTERSVKRLRHYVTEGPKLTPIRPEYLASVLNEEAADDALFFADTGTAVIWASHYLTLGPNRRLMGSFTWASMANAAPNAFGAQLAFPGRQTIALCGDGGFTMLGLGDLLTQVQRGTPVLQVVLNNAELGFVHLEQQEAGLRPYGTDFQNPDFAKVAEAMGATGIRVEDPADLRDAVRRALSHRDGPVVLDVLVDKYALALPEHVPAETVTGFTLGELKMSLGGEAAEVMKNVTHNVRLL